MLGSRTGNDTQNVLVSDTDHLIADFRTNDSLTNESTNSIEFIEESDGESNAGTTPVYEIDAYQSSR